MKKKKGVLLINLGSPKSTKTQDVRRYLREFLMDGRVIDVPLFVRWMIVELGILPSRPKESAKAYQKIWWDEGSPLIVLSDRFKKKLEKKSQFPIALAMRYATPSINEGLKELREKGVTDVYVVPMYPHYAMSSYETVVEKTLKEAKKLKGLQLNFMPVFYNDPEYLKVLSKTIESQLPEEYDTLLFSYHGIPERHIYKTDKSNTCEIGSCCFKDSLPSHKTCYRHQTYKTTSEVIKLLNIPKNKVEQTFQSRLGKNPWLRPYTDHALEAFPKKGVKKLAIVAPAFTTDCLETLEEINMEGRKSFIESGGEEFTYIHCLNDQDLFVDYINHKIESHFKEN